MRPAAWIGLALAALAGAPAWAEAQREDEAQPRQWYCAGSATGSAGSEVTVQIYIQADGTVVSRGVLWDPPRVWTSSVAKPLIGPAPDVTLFYDEASAAGPGKATGVITSATVGRRGGLVDGATVALAMDDGKGRWVATLEAFPFVQAAHGPGFGYASGQLPQIADDGADLWAALEGNGTAVATLAGRKGTVLASARFDFSGKAERDGLFAKAWAQAEEKAKTPTRCDETVAAEGPNVPTP